MKERAEKFFAKLMGGTNNDRFLRNAQPIVAEINRFAERFQELTDDEVKAKTQEFKYRLRMGETLDDLLPEAFAAVKETCRRLGGRSWKVRGQDTIWNMVPYDVQLIGAIALHQGKIAEMATGEGKTLVATMPLYLNALAGKGVHLVTVNDYLAQRDCEWMGEIYQFLGLRAAALVGDLLPDERRQAYNADITYGTNNEFGFDYLRDNMAVDVWSVVQRPLNYAIIDEVDSVLIDEARTPLIISGAVGAPRNVYNELRPIVANLYQRQEELVNQLITQGKELVESQPDEAGLMLLRAHRGDPKNPQLLDLLTKEFSIKRLIERLQGQYEVAKTMGQVDSELYFVIDEKSNIVDITEKGRIFLSGGREQDIAYKIQILDELDQSLSELAEKKNSTNHFQQDSLTGWCNGLTLTGKCYLCGVKNDLVPADEKAIDNLAARLAQIPSRIDQLSQERHSDKSTAWHHFFVFAKKMDKVVDAFSEAGESFIREGSQDDSYQSWAKTLFDVLAMICDQSKELSESYPRIAQDRQRLMLESLFELSSQSSAIVGLTEEGRVALIAARHDGDLRVLPYIRMVSEILRRKESGGNGSDTDASLTQLERKQDYFEFSDNGAVIRHITEKGRIALLGGNPDLYVLPDRTLVEERDRTLQNLYDQTLNQSDYDYSGRVTAALQLVRDIDALLASPAILPQAVTLSRQFDNLQMQISDWGKSLLSDFSDSAHTLLEQIDHALTSPSKEQQLFAFDGQGRPTGLANSFLDQLLGWPFAKVKAEVDRWQAEHGGGDRSELVRRIELDRALEKALGATASSGDSVSVRYETLLHTQQQLGDLFDALNKNELALNEKRRFLQRIFIADDSNAGVAVAADGSLRINGISTAGYRRLVGDRHNRVSVAERFFQLVQDPDIELDALFVLDEQGEPLRFNPAARAALIDDLPFFDYEQEYLQFRDEVIKLMSKKVQNRSELEALLPRDRSHLQSKGYLFDDREVVELVEKCHAPRYVLNNDEIEFWFRRHFNRKPRRVLDAQHDRYWREYNEIEERIQNISQLLKAYTLFHRDVDYVVKTLEESDMRGRGRFTPGQKAVVIVDQFTGRQMPGRRFSDGLHEALEAKEGVQVQAESQTLATITLQNFFRLYKKLAGMTGTAETEAQEFFGTYKMEVVVIPTNRTVIRIDHNDVIFRTKREKYEALLDEALQMHEDGRPVLIGTVSVDVSQRLSEMLTRRGIPVANWLKKGDVSKEVESGRFHTVLNAKYHKQEAEIVSKAGLAGAITIATNMAGRGTDIKLPPEVIGRGGLHIIGSEKHEARRIDRQLRGRSGRQGDPGSSRFYLSLEDDLMRLFGGDRITNIMSRMGGAEQGERIEHPLITRSIERAQKKVEERNFDIRKQLLEYDNVLNDQRKIIYKRRQNLLGFAQPEDFVRSKSKRYFNEEDPRDKWQLDELVRDLEAFFNKSFDLDVAELESLKPPQIRERVEEWVLQQVELDQHLKEMQIRHRILGYTPIENILTELVRIKLQLHNAGSEDPSKWNWDGIGQEMERIFAVQPDFLAAEKNNDAGRWQKRLGEWAVDVYRSRMQKIEQAAHIPLFADLRHEEFLHVFLLGLMNRYLRLTAAPVSWHADEFVAVLERVFMQKPPVSAAEIRDIRREKLEQILLDWMQNLQAAGQGDALRHRVLGILPILFFVGSAVEYSFRKYNVPVDNQVQNLTPQQTEFLQRVFGSVYSELPKEAQTNVFLDAVYQTSSRSMMQKVVDHLQEYDALMLASASTEEMLHAAVSSAVSSAAAQGYEQGVKFLPQIIESILFKRPAKSLPETDDSERVETFGEEMVAWALAHYAEINYRELRIEEERLSSEIVRDSVFSMIDDTLYNLISQALDDADTLDRNMMLRLQSDCRLIFRQSPALLDESDQGRNPADVMHELCEWARSIYQRRVESIGSELATRYERFYVLEKIDENWRQHLAGVDELREGIGLRGYGQKDPLLEYKSEAYKMFVQTIERINRDVVATLYKAFDMGLGVEEERMQHRQPTRTETSHSALQSMQTISAPIESTAKSAVPPTAPRTAVKTSRVGRNDACPCGSGKKYKHCCGRNA